MTSGKPLLEVAYYRHYGLRQLITVDNLREALELARGDECYVEAILVDGIERWRRDSPLFKWTQKTGATGYTEATGLTKRPHPPQNER